MNKKFNVCLLNDSFPPLIDGVANAVLNYARIIEKSYGKAVVATPSHPDAKDDYPFDVVRYWSIDTPSKKLEYRAGNPFLVSTIKKIKPYNIDIIHSHCPIASTLLARSLRESLDAPIVFTYHTKFDIEIKKNIEFKPFQSIIIKLLAENISACDDVWVVSNGAGENLRSLGYKGDYTVMENGVDFPKGTASKQMQETVIDEHKLDMRFPVFLFVGRMMWYKGIRIIIDALNIIKNSGFVFKMLFVGGGAELEEIKEYAEKCGISDFCIFTGPVHDREKLKAYFSISDLFLFPSTYDTNGIVVREAAACSLASVIIKDSCASENIIDGQNGILIDENAPSLAAVLRDACNHRDKSKQIGENAMNEIYISWEDAVSKAVNRYAVVADNYRSGAKKYTTTTTKDSLFYILDDLYRDWAAISRLGLSAKAQGVKMYEAMIKYFK